MAELTQTRVQSLFNYDPETGLLTWRDRPISDFKSKRGWSAYHSQFAGKIAAAMTGEETKRYRVVRIDRVLYLQHRVVWLHVHGKWPNGLLDHRNLDGTDNRISNLREATYSQNHANRGFQGQNMSGLKGSFYDPSIGRWRCRIGVGGKSLHIGIFDSAEAAHQAYVEAARKHYGQFSRPE